MQQKYLQSIENQITNSVKKYFSENKKITTGGSIFDILDEGIYNIGILSSEENPDDIVSYTGKEFIYRFKLKFSFMMKKEGSSMKQKKDVICNVFQAKYRYEQINDDFLLVDIGHISIMKLGNVL